MPEQMASLPKDYGIDYDNLKAPNVPNRRRPTQRTAERVRARHRRRDDRAGTAYKNAETRGFDSIIDSYLGHGRLTVLKAIEEDLPLAVGCALRDQESGGQNIFGCDHGDVGDRPPYCGHDVTKWRCEALRAGGTYRHGMNGIGETQITWWEFVEDMFEMGGAHLPENQLTVGFRLMATYLEKYSALEAYGAYNAGETNRRMVINSYARPFARKVQAWHQRLYSGG